MGIPPGLCNLGNTCYANAAIQALLATPAFADAVLKNVKAGVACEISEELRALFVDMILLTRGDAPSAVGRVVNPSKLLGALARKLPCISGGGGVQVPQDAHEVMITMLEVLRGAGEVHPTLSELLGGGCMRHVTRCLTCGRSWASPATWQEAEEYTCIMLPRPEGGRRSGSSSLLNEYLKPETGLGWRCEKCDSTTGKMERRVQLQRMPQMLILCVPFVGEGDSGGVVFPSRQFSILQARGQSVTRYRLCSVVSHKGSSTNGHYTAYARSRLSATHEWYECDDDRVIRVPWELVSNASAYVMIYQKGS